MYGGSRCAAPGSWTASWNSSRRGSTQKVLIDAELSCVDGTSIRAIRAAAGTRRKKPVSGEPTNHTFWAAAGAASVRSSTWPATDGASRWQRSSPPDRCTSRRGSSGSWAGPGRDAALCGLGRGRGYSYPRIRRWLARHGIKAVVPRRSDQRPEDGRVRFDREAYQRRAVVGQCVGWPKECRAVATRFLGEEQTRPAQPRRFVLRSMVARAGRAAGLWR